MISLTYLSLLKKPLVLVAKHRLCSFFLFLYLLILVFRFILTLYLYIFTLVRHLQIPQAITIQLSYFSSKMRPYANRFPALTINLFQLHRCSWEKLWFYICSGFVTNYSRCDIQRNHITRKCSPEKENSDIRKLLWAPVGSLYRYYCSICYRLFN